ncbi:phosphomethylpyrimidine kinase [Pontibacillus chungwhensis BH030062]|uniref:Hydroxymethylpyrimidine/phosphomethylpyrimidine kinase n=1 Tax=Pontibacillus chungwhensis BH030062 TaxID=1385513 RepID=A0A0A2UZR0_9BACI|nr:bifunctional hydroxymethylpyrimidine kinase/phosphomethylpyrimidine kinase [Pontibacillus chungwhensis]KGP92263.1 phosphomethylpyrimidine kinase [Pontibacillus chungwhensis BH030062]
MRNVKGALSIAGTDPSGGAGIQADLKTFQELEVYGMSVITSVVAQNTLGVKGIRHLEASFIKEQLESVTNDMPVHAVKTGMIANSEMIEAIAEHLRPLTLPLCVDPVMIAQSGDALVDHKALQAMRDELLPLATIVTPNIPEAAALTGRSLESEEDRYDAAKRIVHDFGSSSVVIKGGHLDGEATDLFYDGDTFKTFTSPRFDTLHTHGTGCTYAAAITAELAKGKSLNEAVSVAKTFISAAIEHTLEIGHGQGPTNHWAYQNTKRKGEYV